MKNPDTTHSESSPVHRQSAGWQRVKLAAVCTLNPRRPKDLHRADGQPTTFVPMPAVDERSGEITAPLIRPFGEVRKGYTYFKEGDVLFAKITPCMQNGKHAIARGLVDNIGFGSTEFHVLRPGPEVTSEWIHRFIRQRAVLQEAVAHFSGAVGQQRVPDSYLANLEIPLPPLVEQRRIVARLNEQMAAIETAGIAVKAQLEAAARLATSFVQQTYEGSEMTGYPVRRIADIAHVQSGYAFRSEWFAAKGIRLLRNANVFQGFISWHDEVRLPEHRRSEFQDFELNMGDIVLSLDRPIVANGIKVAKLTEKDVPSLLLQRVARFQLREGTHPDFLYYFLNSPMFRNVISGHDQSLGVPHISPSQVAATALPLPTLEHQVSICHRLEMQLSEIMILKEALRNQLLSIDTLRTRLLSEAFSRGCIL